MSIKQRFDQEPIYLMDGSAFVYRGFYANQSMQRSDGFPTSALFIVARILMRILREEQPTHFAFVLDGHGPNFRHDMFALYKAQRSATPEDLIRQMDPIHRLIHALGLHLEVSDSCEADDCLASLALRYRDERPVVLVATDKDLKQCLHSNVLMWDPASRDEKIVTLESFQAETGLTPSQWPDVQAIIGDSSDNIPGVKGVGEKTAMALVQRYQTVDALYAAMPDIEAKPAAIRKLAEGEESARMSYHLATILTDAPLDFQPDQNLRRPVKAELYDIFLRLEFNKLIEKMGLSAPAQPRAEKPEETDYTVVHVELAADEAQAEKLLEAFRKAEFVTVLALPDLTGIVVDCNTGKDTALAGQFYFDRYSGDWNKLLSSLFSADIKKVSHDVKDLMRTLLESGLPAEGFIFDTALAGYLLDATAGHYDIGRLFASWFREELQKPLYLDPDAFSMLGDRVQAEASFLSYAAAVAALYEAMLPKLKETGVDWLYFNVELPLCQVLAEMENAGFRVDARALQSFGKTLSAALETLEKQIYSYAGKFNINSPKQLGEVLFDKLGMPAYKKTKTGYSTNAEVLDKLRGQHPIVGEVLEYRQYAKLKSTYVDGLLKVIPADGRVRTSFQMTVTATGRLSSTEPNLQNIPTRTELGSELRRMFTAEPGKVLVDADYSQIELRLLAHISGDQAMQEAFLDREDFHTVTAAHVFGVPIEQVTANMRRAAKAVNFGIVYGISAFSLSQDLGVAVAEAKAYMDAYFARFPGVKAYMDGVVQKAREDGYVETMFHRRRALPEIKASNFNTRSFGERVALNMPIQGAAADIIKLAMVKVFTRLKKEALQARLIMQVHDELIVECPEDEAERVKALLAEEMEGVYALAVPLTAEAHSGKNWLEAK